MSSLSTPYRPLALSLHSRPSHTTLRRPYILSLLSVRRPRSAVVLLLRSSGRPRHRAPRAPPSSPFHDRLLHSNRHHSVWQEYIRPHVLRSMPIPRGQRLSIQLTNYPGSVPRLRRVCLYAFVTNDLGCSYCHPSNHDRDVCCESSPICLTDRA